MDLSLEDALQHVAKFGIDIYPPVDLAIDRTRLHMFFEEARSSFPALYEHLSTSDSEFKVAKDFRQKPERPTPSCRCDTFNMTNRGPVFSFPLRLPEVGDTGLTERFVAQFHEVRRIFFGKLPGRKMLRVGLVRELLFHTGTTLPTEVLTSQTEFAGAQLARGGCYFVYRDDRCNVALKFDTAEITKSTQLPIGKTLTESTGHGLLIQLDVNNHEIRPLEDADIDGIIERATVLWPDKVLEFLRERREA